MRDDRVLALEVAHPVGRWAPLRGVLLTVENGRLTPLTALQLLSSM